MDIWKTYRRKHLRKLEEALKEEAVDVPIIPVLNVINNKEEFVTTSSCSGRVVLLATDLYERKEPSSFVGKWHRPVMVEEVLDKVSSFEGMFLWFKVEPFILHLASKDLESAKRILSIARESGIKVAGVQSFREGIYHIELRNIEYMAVPVVWEGERVLEDATLSKMVNIANWKMVKNQQRLQRFYENLLKSLNPII